MLMNRVHECRIKKDMTQQELADAVGVTRQTVIAIEKRNYVPSVALALSLAHLFKKSVEEIFFYE